MARRKSSSKFISGAIKRPGALTRAKKKGESTDAAARRLAKSGSTKQKQRANFYLRVLKPASKKSGKKKSSSTSSPRRNRRVGRTHKVKAHTRIVGKGHRVRVKSHRRRSKR
jgi:hypothetical protein